MVPPGGRVGRCDHVAAAELTQNYCQLRGILSRTLARRLYLSASEFEELYQDAWREVVRRTQRGQPVHNYRSFLTGVIINLWKMELRSRRRHPTVPLDDGVEAQHGADLREPAPDDRIATHETARLALELIESIPNARRRQILKLRLACGMSTDEVQRAMSISERTYRRLLTDAMHDIEQKLALVEDGEWCADRRELLDAYAHGTADEQQALQARRHLHACLPCRFAFAELRHALPTDAAACLGPLVAA